MISSEFGPGLGSPFLYPVLAHVLCSQFMMKCGKFRKIIACSGPVEAVGHIERWKVCFSEGLWSFQIHFTKYIYLICIQLEKTAG